MAELSDVELLSELRAVLAPPPTRPDERTLARLQSTLLELDRELKPANSALAVGRRGTRRESLGDRRRRSTSRSSVFVASALALSLSAGAAAAAVATDTLPGPMRAIAYDLGLPVTSPGLFQAKTSLTQLKAAIVADEHQRERRVGHQLIREMGALNASDLAQIHKSADKLLAEVGLRVPKPVGDVTTPITTTSHVPTVTVPSVTVPKVTVPSVTVPGVTVPSVTVPKVTVPTVTQPRVTVPGVTVPDVTVPTVTVPKVTTSGHQLPTFLLSLLGKLTL